ncbi:MAG: PQQ-like beta-propeller repeat protein [Holophagales bacterium]|nr:PQQ-like beta-propeller repeat protein [Holophagales bacterium]MYC08687.1 PQQ-like beta-propeller repeat protein [Holophagales bacterium]
MNRPASSARLPALVLLLAAGCAREQPPEWPQFRGPGGLGVSTSQALPLEWSLESENVRWSAPLAGRGNSSPIVALDTVYLTEARRAAESPEGVDKTFERWLLALDAATGTAKWETPVVSTAAEPKHWLSTHAAVTPAADRDGVYVYFGSHLARVSHGGEVDWLIDVDPAYAAHSRYGAASSPVLASDVVIAMQDREWGYTRTEDAGWLAAFERETGALRWKVEWAGQEGPCCTYTTPLVLEGPRGERLIVAWSWFVREYDLETGEVLWSRDYEINQLASSPVFENDLLIVSGGAHAVKGTQAFSFAAGEADSEPALLWGNKAAVPETSSPLLLDGILYTVTDFGVMSAWRASTGELLWRERLPRGQYRASLVGGEGRIYAASQRGVAVLAAGEKFEVLAENDLGGAGRSSNASPATGGGCLLLRTVAHLHCVSVDIDGAENLEAGLSAAVAWFESG